VNHYTYSSFGEVSSHTNAVEENELRFAAREQSEDTKLLYLRQRYYDATLGRFVAEDPIEPFGYAYADNSPTLLVDPLGTNAATSYLPTIQMSVPLAALSHVVAGAFALTVVATLAAELALQTSPLDL
jgi:RHS repeat-associated protein